MISSSIERLAARQQSSGKFFSPFNSCPKNRLGNSIQFRVGSIEQDHAPLGKHARVETRKGAAERFTGAIGLAQKPRRLRITEQVRGLFDQRQNLVAQAHRANRRSGNVVARGREHLQPAVRARDGNVIHLCQVMIVSGQPKNRNGVHSGCRRFFGKLDRGERFVDSEHRSTEKPDLLTGNDRGRTVAQPFEIAQSFRGSVPGFVLPLKNAGDSPAARGVVRNLCGLVLQPLAKTRRSRIKLLGIGLICQKVCE